MNKESNSEIKQIKKNSAWNAFAKLFSKGISLVMSILIARFIGVEGTGQYTIAITYAGLLYVILNFGVFSIVQREIAKNINNATAYFSNALSLFIYISIPLAVFFVIGLNNILALDTPNFLLILACLYIGLCNVFTLISNALEGIDKFNEECNATIIYNTIVIVAAAPLLYIFRKIEVLLYLNILVFFIVDLYFIYRINKWYFRVSIWFDTKNLKVLLRNSYPLIFSSASEYINLKSDSLLIGYIKGDYATGLYSTASNIYQGLSCIPQALATAFSPTFARSYLTTPIASKVLFRKTFIGFLLLLVIMSGGIIICSGFLIDFLYGADFKEAAIALSMLAIALIPMEANRFFNNALIAMNQQKVVAVSIFIGMVSNVVLNIILIPIYSFYAAAATTIISELIVAIIDLIFIIKCFRRI